MVKKTLLAVLVLLGVLFGEMTEACFADVAAQLEQAETCRENGDYFEAEAIYKTIITDSPDTKEALMSQRGLAIVYILTQRSFDAEAAVDKLTAGMAKYPIRGAMEEQSLLIIPLQLSAIASLENRLMMITPIPKQ